MANSRPMNEKPDDVEKIREEVQRRTERYDRRLGTPFAKALAIRLFIIQLILSVGLGALELVASFAEGYAVAPVYAVGSVLIAALLPGLPLVILCTLQLSKLQKNGMAEHAKDVGFYRVVRRIAAGTLAVLAIVLAAVFVWTLFT